MTTEASDNVCFLLVDDLEENILALEGLLRRDGLTLLKARSGEEALEYLLQFDIALAFLDVQMPGMDGFELAELMRGTERTRRVPIIFVTAGLADSERRFRGYETGAVDFLQKPIDPDMLRGKAAVFFDLYRQRQEVARQRDEINAAVTEVSRLFLESEQLSEALTDAGRRKDEFLATLAHELRNPLAPLRNGLELLRVAPPGSDIALNSREMMERQLEHLVRLVDDLLDISRITSGKIILQRKPIKLREIAQLAVETTRPLLDAAEHKLELHFPEEDIWVNADITRLAQALSNLLSNAAKYTPAGGRVSVSCRREDGLVVIDVTDTGFGIPTSMLAEVFVMFSQVNRTLDRAQGGLGIGLALVRRLVELHGGSVSAFSEGEGKGSTFTLRVPTITTPVPESVSPAPKITVDRAGHLRILVVDDNVDAAESLALLLELEGHELRTAHSGEAALVVIKEFLPHTVILDIGLPDMSGLEVAKTVRADPNFNNTMLVALTGWGSEQDKEQTKAAGFDSHLTKPVEIEKLDQLFAELTSSRAASIN